MLRELERPAVKGAGHVEGGVAVFEAAVAERHDDLALRHNAAVEIRDAIIGPGIGPGIGRGVGAAVAHPLPPSNSGARVSANSSTAATSLSPSASSSAIDNAIMPRLANQMPRATRSK